MKNWDQGLEFDWFQFWFCSGTKFNRPNSPSWSIKWIRHQISVATDLPWRQLCGDRPVLRTSASVLSSLSFRYLSRISISLMKDAPIGNVLITFSKQNFLSHLTLIACNLWIDVGYRMVTSISKNSGSWLNKWRNSWRGSKWLARSKNIPKSFIIYKQEPSSAKMVGYHIDLCSTFEWN